MVLNLDAALMVATIVPPFTTVWFPETVMTGPPLGDGAAAVLITPWTVFADAEVAILANVSIWDEGETGESTLSHAAKSSRASSGHVRNAKKVRRCIGVSLAGQ